MTKTARIMVSILIKESLSVCHANKLPLFGGVFSTPRQSSRTIAALPYTFNVHYTFGGYALEAQVRGKPHFHNALTIVQAAPDWPTLVIIYCVFVDLLVFSLRMP